MMRGEIQPRYMRVQAGKRTIKQMHRPSMASLAVIFFQACVARARAAVQFHQAVLAHVLSLLFPKLAYPVPEI